MTHVSAIDRPNSLEIDMVREQPTPRVQQEELKSLQLRADFPYQLSEPVNEAAHRAGEVFEHMAGRFDEMVTSYQTFLASAQEDLGAGRSTQTIDIIGGYEPKEEAHTEAIDSNRLFTSLTAVARRNPMLEESVTTIEREKAAADLERTAELSRSGKAYLSGWAEQFDAEQASTLASEGRASLNAHTQERLKTATEIVIKRLHQDMGDEQLREVRGMLAQVPLHEDDLVSVIAEQLRAHHIPSAYAIETVCTTLLTNYQHDLAKNAQYGVTELLKLMANQATTQEEDQAQPAQDETPTEELPKTETHEEATEEPRAQTPQQRALAALQRVANGRALNNPDVVAMTFMDLQRDQEALQALAKLGTVIRIGGEGAPPQAERRGHSAHRDTSTHIKYAGRTALQHFLFKVTPHRLPRRPGQHTRRK